MWISEVLSIWKHWALSIKIMKLTLGFVIQSANRKPFDCVNSKTQKIAKYFFNSVKWLMHNKEFAENVKQLL